MSLHRHGRAAVLPEKDDLRFILWHCAAPVAARLEGTSTGGILTSDGCIRQGIRQCCLGLDEVYLVGSLPHECECGGGPQPAWCGVARGSPVAVAARLHGAADPAAPNPGARAGRDC